MVKKMTIWGVGTLLLICSVIIANCGPSQSELDATATKFAKDIFDTQTAEVPPPTKTGTPTPTPTKTPTPTSTPRPLSDAIVALEDLPSGFQPESLSDFDVEPGSGSGLVVLTNESGFVYILDAEEFEIIVGQTELLENRSDQAEWDNLTNLLAEPMMNMIAQAVSGTNATSLREISDLEEIGESSSGYSGTIGGTPSMNMDMVLFRRDKLGAYTYIIYYTGDELVVSISEVAKILDTRIINLLDLE